jgi:endothelin-converting enzyme
MQLKAAKKSADEENFDKMKASYEACLNEDQIKSVGVAPLMKVLDEIKKAYPITTSTSSDSHAVKDAILLLAKYGVSSLVSTGTGADDTDPDTVVVSVAAPYSFGLPSKERYKDVAKYRDVVAEVLSALYPDQNKDVFAKIVDFEKRLSAASPSSEDRDDVTVCTALGDLSSNLAIVALLTQPQKYYNPMLLDDAAAIAPEIELKDLLYGLAPAQSDIKRIIVMAPDYVKELSIILAATDKEVVRSYFVWKAVQAFSSYIDADAVKPYKRFRNVLSGRDPDSAPERWRTCVSHVDGVLGWILSRFFVEKAFSAEAKQFGDTIITDIKTEFSKKLEAADWMDDGTTKKAVEKVHNIVQKIGYPTKSPDIMDPTILGDYYGSLNISSQAFFDNVIAANRFSVQYQWSALGKPVDRDEWGMTVPTVNAYYNPPGNEICFPGGIMQRPVFDVEAPEYMSYGAFGSVAGHELSHAFDSTGRHYDQNGNYTDWWSDSTIEAFKTKTECFVDQYANFSVSGPDGKPLHVNGRLTLGENIADAGGLSASFQAWKRRSTEKPAKDLPGLEHFTQDQLFFVTYSNWWCGKTRKDTAINRIYTDPHAPKTARVLGTMANSREFKESFKCKIKEPTCQLW